MTNEAALAVGVRNSLDKSFALGFVAGARVFCCDNLAFTSSEVLVSRKHTRWGETRYAEAISLATTKLGAFQAQEARRITCLQQWELSPQQADSLILQAYEKDIIGARLLPLAIKAWRNPHMEDFRPRTGWSLLNAFTEVLKERQKSSPQAAALQTIQLQRLLNPPDVIDVESTPVIAG